MKHFGLTGINANVQFGKDSGRVKYNTDHFEVRNTADNSLIAVQAASPTNSNDLATKQYVDNAIQGLHVKDAVKVATDTVTANDMANLSYNSGSDIWTLTGTTLDGITVGNSRVLIKDATNKKGNGIFVNSGGSLTRVSDSTFGGGDFVFVQEGTIWADSGWVVSLPNTVANIGIHDIEFAQFSSISGVYATDGIGKTGNQVYIKTDDTTTHITGDTISVKSTATQYQVLTSTGTATEDARWDTVNLASASAVTGILPKTNGGFGQDPDTFIAQSLITSCSPHTGSNSSIICISVFHIAKALSLRMQCPIANRFFPNPTTASSSSSIPQLLIGDSPFSVPRPRCWRKNVRIGNSTCIRR